MATKSIPILAITAVSLAVLSGIVLAAQDRFTVKVPNGLSFSEFRGYDTWQDVAVSTTEDSIKAILANPVMIKAYREGTPGNGKAFPEGARVVKIEWVKAMNPVAPYYVQVPQILKSIGFMVRDTKRFPETHGWAFAKFDYDAATQSFKPSAPLSSIGHECGYACHTAVAANDYIFTAYPQR